MAPLKPEYFDAPCLKKLAIKESQYSTINDLVQTILYGDINNLGIFNNFLQTIDFDEPVIENAEDVVLFLRALDNGIYKNDFINGVENYLDTIAYGKFKYFYLLLSKVVSELEESDTLKMAHGICISAWYIKSRDLAISRNISDLIATDFFDAQMNKSMEYGNEVTNQYKTKTMVNIFKFLSIVYFLYHLFN